ncbi:MAG: efflux RND transporter periplasmic adaptor subunit [bacterium]|nr:efflux RND transporter periplasmic adaptor subunit [bacterium]
MPAEPDQKTRSRRFLPWILLAALLLAGVALRRTVFAPDPIEVRVASVARGRVEATVTNSKAGTVEARRRSRIASEIGGQVVSIAHREGDRVGAGEPLVRLSPRSQEAQLELAVQGVSIARAGLEDACLRRDRAQRELARTKRLAESSVASEDRLDELQYRYDSARVACDGAKAELARAEAQQRSAETELAKTEIRAPFAGIVAEVNVEVGEWVTPSPPLLTSPPVIDLIDPASIFVSAPMDEVDSGAIRPGLPVKVTVDSRPGERFAGSVLRVAPYVLDEEAQNRTLEIEVALVDAAVAESLLPGTSADAEVVLDARDDVIRVPTSALMRNERVLVLEDGELVEREIEVGLRNWQFAEVRSGLEEDERLVVALDRLEIVAGARAVPDADSTSSDGASAERDPDVAAGRDS